jgi:hypothetical protein
LSANYGSSYQSCCLSQPWIGSALTAHLLATLSPDVYSIWNNNDFFLYTDRWYNFGVYTAPDPCAPIEGICNGGTNDGKPCTAAGGCPGGTCELSMANYKKTFGPDGNGDCIRDTDSSDGIGRFPQAHHQSANTGGRGSSFQQNMWKAYRGAQCFNGVCEPGETAQTCPFDCDPEYAGTSSGERKPFIAPLSRFNRTIRLVSATAIAVTVYDLQGRVASRTFSAPMKSIVVSPQSFGVNPGQYILRIDAGKDVALYSFLAM